MNLIQRIFSDPARADAASELALARAEKRAASADHQRCWDAFSASADRLKSATDRLTRARARVLDEVEALARDSGSGSESEDAGTAAEAEGPQSGGEAASPKPSSPNSGGTHDL